MLLFLLNPVLVSAHGPVTTQTKTSGNYTIEFEYSTLGHIFVGDYVTYDVVLTETATHREIEYDWVLVKFEKNGRVALSANLAPSINIKGMAAISSSLAEAGIYNAEVVFYKDQNKIASSKFDFEVRNKNIASSPETGSRTPWLWTAGGLIAVALIVLGVIYFKK
jgi:hypothetical protein